MRTLTEAGGPGLAVQLQAHLAAMYARLNQGAEVSRHQGRRMSRLLHRAGALAVASVALAVAAPAHAALLDTEPYEAGIAPVAIQFPEAGGQVPLLGYPAQNIWIRLTIGRRDRITAETLADPDHLITRTYTYPEK